MEQKKGFDGLFKEAEGHLDYWVETAILDLTEDVARLMDEKGVSRSELARRIGTSPAYVTQVLRGNANYTLKTMTKLGLALDSELRIHLAPKGSRTRWHDDIRCGEGATLGTTYSARMSTDTTSQPMRTNTDADRPIAA
jgi:transcriptional regulator with XRE-family HTH domain